MSRWKMDMERAPLLALVFFLVLGLVGAKIAELAGAFEPGPPLDVTLEAHMVSEGRVAFLSYGTKLTDRALIAQSAAWMFSDGTAMPVPATLLDAPPGEPPVLAVREQGEYFVSRYYEVPVIAAVRSDRGAALRVCWIYEEHRPYCQQIVFETIQPSP